MTFSGTITTEPKTSEYKDMTIVKFQMTQEIYNGPKVAKGEATIAVEMQFKTESLGKRLNVVKKGNKLHICGKYTTKTVNGVMYPILKADASWELGFADNYNKNNQQTSSSEEDGDDLPY